jgi:outer membrane receptor for Fe3+-dicitrate
VLIQIAETHPAAPGKKTASVVAVGGSKFDCWPEMLAKIEIGRRYEVEVKDRVFQGRTYQSITKATPYAEDGDSTVATKAAARAAENGCGSGISYQHTDRDSERAFVCATLTAFIKAGKVEAELGKVSNAITVLRTAYQKTFGIDDGISTPSGAGHPDVARE